MTDDETFLNQEGRENGIVVVVWMVVSSGTTLVDALLCAHPAARCLGERSPLLFARAR